MKYKLIAAALLASVTAFAADPNPLGLQCWSLRNQLIASLPQGMAEIKTLGFSQIETASTYGHTAKEFRALADANGLTIVGSHIPYERMQSDLDGVIAEAKTLGASYVVVAWVPHKTDFDVSQAKAAVANFNAWGAKLKAAGLGFGFHTHGYEFAPLADGSSAFDIMMTQTDPELVFCEMDLFWVVQAGIDPVALLDKYPNRFKAFHIKDMKKGAPVHLYQGHAPASDNVIVGQGVMDWPAIVAEGKKVGIKYWFIEDETADPVGNIPPSVTYLETLGLKP
jgi:sugar phosphate isomerase/epimerase